jgi:hypothetical protein
VDQRQGLGDGDRHHHRLSGIASFPWNITIQVMLSLLLGALSCSAWAMFGSALRPMLTSRKACGPQYRDGGAAAGLTLSLFMDAMPHRAMQKRVSPDGKML